jgi:uncharacterized protein (DUF362 family)
MKLTRRHFLAASAVAGLGVIGGYLYLFSGKRRDPIISSNIDGDADSVNEASKIYLVETSERAEGVRTLLQEYQAIDFRDKSVALKANFNSADPPPASTHPDTLIALMAHLQDAGVGPVTLAERSGMGNTSAVLQSIGVHDLGDRLGFTVVNLDILPAEGWEKIEADWLTWRNGFYIAKTFRESDTVIQTCCLKTHRYGGHFTMTLKNSVGLIAKKAPGDPHDYMTELHTSPNQRTMIAEINAFYDVDLNIMDAVQAFTTGGPAKGTLAQPNLMLASTDRVALDAAGVAILRSHGTTPEVTKGTVFEQEQIRRAAEIGVGATSPEDIELIPLNDGATEKAQEIREHLA